MVIMTNQVTVVTAAAIIIGNEILSGRTLDINTQEIALRLNEVGIGLMETRTIPDNEEMIVQTVRELSNKYDYVFTTGGIGPTHDDITAKSIAKAFNVKCLVSQEIYDILQKHYAKIGETVNEARKKMAYIPESAILLANDVTAVPGFAINNVFVMAGIPSVMKSMLKYALPMLKKGKQVKTESLEIRIGESKIAAEFEQLQNKYQEVEMGSYPFTKEGAHHTCLVLRSANYDALAAAFVELKKIMATK